MIWRTVADSFIRETEGWHSGSARACFLPNVNRKYNCHTNARSHRTGLQICDVQVVHDIDKLLRRFKHTRNFLIRDADESQRVEERNTKKIVSVDLRPTDLVPRSICRVASDGCLAMNTRRLI